MHYVPFPALIEFPGCTDTVELVDVARNFPNYSKRIADETAGATNL